jgi:hypothetical protein
MATIRDLLAVGLDPDTELFARRSDEDDVAYRVVHEVRHSDSPSGEAIIILSLTDDFIVIADEDEDADAPLMGDGPTFLEPFEG